MGSQPTGGEPGGEIRKFFSSRGGRRRSGFVNESRGVGSALKTRRRTAGLCFRQLEPRVNMRRHVPELCLVNLERITGCLRLLSGVLIIIDDNYAPKSFNRCPCVYFAEGSEMCSQSLKYKMLKEVWWK